jgi:hypothetical protein
MLSNVFLSHRDEIAMPRCGALYAPWAKLLFHGLKRGLPRQDGDDELCRGDKLDIASTISLLPCVDWGQSWASTPHHSPAFFISTTTLYQITAVACS